MTNTEYINITELDKEFYSTPFSEICKKYHNQKFIDTTYTNNHKITTLLDEIILKRFIYLNEYTNKELIKQYQLKSNNPQILLIAIQKIEHFDPTAVYFIIKHIIDTHPIENCYNIELLEQTRQDKSKKYDYERITFKNETLSEYYKKYYKRRPNFKIIIVPAEKTAVIETIKLLEKNDLQTKLFNNK